MDNSTTTSNDASHFQLYRYDPSLPAAVVSAAVFGILTILHAWRLWRSRALYFIPFAIGGVFQTVGYCGRIWSHFAPTAIGGFVMQALLILVAPALYAASIYMILGRLLRALHTEHLSLVPVHLLTRIFVVGDVISFLLQGGGGGIQSAGSLTMFDIGEKIIIAGLFVQVLFFGFFVATTAVLHRRISNQSTEALFATNVPWQRHLYVLYTVSGIILVRSIFRVVEYLQGNGGYLISHEIFLYIFDALLMAIVMTMFLMYYVDDLGKRAKSKTSSVSPGYQLSSVEGEE